MTTTWKCSNATTCSLSINNGTAQSIPLSGTRKDTIKGNLIFSFTASGSDGVKATTHNDTIITSIPVLTVYADSLHHTFGVAAKIIIFVSGLDSVSSNLPVFNGHSGTYTTDPLITPVNKYHFNGYLGGNIVRANSVVVYVNDSTPTAIFCQNMGLKLRERYISFDTLVSNPWTKYVLPTFVLDQLHFFYPNGLFKIYFQSTQVLYCAGSWNFFYSGSQFKINWGGVIYSVNKITRDTIVLTGKEICAGCQEGDSLYAKYIYTPNAIPFILPKNK
ncbi:MAG: hypothetical protein WCS03_19140 [Bacteroidota bacterium]